MTFNVRNAALDQDDLDQNKHWSLRRNVVNKILTTEQCDIIGTQEGTITQIEDISISLHGLYGDNGNGRQPTEWYQSSMDIMNEKCSIFWKRETLSVYDYGTFWLSDEPNIAGSKYSDAALSRIATWSLLDIKDNSKYQILFISTHLGLNQNVRNKQIKLVTKFVDEMMSNQTGKELLVFVVGDFNEPIGGPLWQQVNADGVLTDCISEIMDLKQSKLNVEFTYHAFNGLQHAENDENHAPIDWILCSKNVVKNNDIRLLNACVVTDSETNINGSVYPSDHFPVVLEFEIIN